jgi:hypothetical protein
MKKKDNIEIQKEFDDKVKNIKKRKRSLDKLTDPFLKKKIKKDLNNEYRSSKRSEKNEIKQWMKDQINKDDETI